MRTHKIALLLAASFCLASCAGKQSIGPNGYSESYAEGYSDGCHSTQRGRLLNDDDRYDDEKDYGIGWGDGFRSCETDAEKEQRRLRTNNLIRGVNKDMDAYHETYRLGQQPSKKVTQSIRMW